MSYLMPHYSAKETEVTTLRPSSTSLFLVDSEDRFSSYTQSRAATGTSNNATPYNFQITRKESLMNGFASRIAVSEVNFPWAIPNINPKTSQITVSYEVSGLPVLMQTLNLFPGFYKPASIAAALELGIQGLHPSLAGATVVYGEGSNPVFTYATNSTTQIAFSPLPYNSAVYPYPDTTKQLFDLLGFTNANNALDVGGNGNFTFCQAIRYVDIVSINLVYNQANPDVMSQNVARNSLCRVYLGDANLTGNVDPASATFCPPGCAPVTIYRNFTNPKQIQWLGNQPIPGTLQFTVFDDTGAPLNETLVGLLDGEYLDWSLTMLVTEN